MGSISFTEILLVMVVAVLVYGKDLPTMARRTARLYGKLRRYLKDVRDEISQHLPDEEIMTDSEWNQVGPPSPTSSPLPTELPPPTATKVHPEPPQGPGQPSQDLSQ